MPTEAEIKSERERLYESAVLREELNDDEATILLEWGEKHVIRLAGEAADGAALEQQARFLRQLLKNMNRFVGQRQYNNRDEQLEYLAKVIQWLGKLGFKEYSGPDLLDQLPSDSKDMNATLRALIKAIDPSNLPPGASDKPAQGPHNDAPDHNLPAGASSKPAQGPHNDAPDHDLPAGASGKPVQGGQLSSLKEALAAQAAESSDEEVRNRMRQASKDGSPSEHMEKPHSEPKENEALDALRKNLGVQPSDSLSEERHMKKQSSSGGDSTHSEQPKSIYDELKNILHMRDEDQDDGKE